MMYKPYKLINSQMKKLRNYKSKINYNRKS